MSTLSEIELRTQLFHDQSERLASQLADNPALRAGLRTALVSGVASPFTGADALFATGDALLEAAREVGLCGQAHLHQALRRTAAAIDALATQEDRRDF